MIFESQSVSSVIWFRTQKRKGPEGPLRIPTEDPILLIFGSQCLSWCLFYDEPSINFCCLELKQCNTHGPIAAHSYNRGGGCFFKIVQSDFWSFSRLAAGSEATRQQALVSRGERAVCLCFARVVIPETDIPGELSNSLTVLARRR